MLSTWITTTTKIIGASCQKSLSISKLLLLLNAIKSCIFSTFCWQKTCEIWHLRLQNLGTTLISRIWCSEWPTRTLMNNHFGISSSFVLRMIFFHYVKSIFSFFINLNVVRSCSFLRWAFSRGCRIEKLFSLPISFHLLEETNLTFNSRKKSFFWKKKKIKGKELSSKIVLWHVSAIKRKQWLDFYF